MDLTRLRRVLEHPGPMATVYLESRPPGEDSGDQSRLRWQAVREELKRAGATAPPLDAIASALRQDPVGEIQADGRVLVAADDGVLLDAPWDASIGTGDFAYWSDAAQLDRFVREALTAVRALVAIATQKGAQVRQEVLGEQNPDGVAQQEMAGASHTIEGTSDARVHKPREGYMSHKQIQRRADEAVHRNAADIAAHLGRTADRFRPEMLVLAGPVEGRTAVHGELPEYLTRICVEADRGGDQDAGAEAALAAQIDEVADGLREHRLSANTEDYNLAKSRGLVVHGAADVAAAARQGAVRSVVLSHDSQDAPAGEALAAASACGADVMLADLGTDGEVDGAGVAAVLRFAVPTE